MNILEIIPRTKRTAGAARILLALAVGDAARVSAMLAALPGPPDAQRIQLRAELERCIAVLASYVPMLRDLPSNAPWPSGAISLAYIVPGAPYPTPTAAWPHRILAAVEALREHAADMQGELLRQLAAAIRELPELVTEVVDDVVDVVTPAVSVTPYIIGGIAAVAVVGGLVYLARSA